MNEENKRMLQAVAIAIGLAAVLFFLLELGEE
jgi:hypothetical protein